MKVISEEFGATVVGTALCVFGQVQIDLYCAESGIDWSVHKACGLAWGLLFLLFFTCSIFLAGRLILCLTRGE